MRFLRSWILDNLRGMSYETPVEPLITIVGATGTGKSNLAVALAQRFNGEVINGDALQLYKGLPITTNKIPEYEMKGIPHHLLGCIGLDEPTWTVGCFTEKASNILNDIRAKGKLPILVGGTHYYTQALLFQGHQLETGGQVLSNEELEKEWPILKASNKEMLEELRRIDPDMAARWHPNDARKIRRSLEIWLQTGKRASEVYAQQRKNGSHNGNEGVGTGNENEAAFSDSAGSAMRHNSLMFWIHSEHESLTSRLAKRVDVMVENGLLEEIKTMRAFEQEQRRSGAEIDMSRGIWMAIGYKQFEGYLSALESDTTESNLSSMKEIGVEKTSIATRQYAKRQVRWIRLKLLTSLQAAGALERMFLLDGTQVEDFAMEVEGKACAIAHEYLAGRPLPDPTTLNKPASALLRLGQAASPELKELRTSYCDVCDVTTATAKDWDIHLKSKKHKKLLRRQRNLNEA